MSKKPNMLSIGITLILFVVLVSVAGILFSAVSKDVSIEDFTITVPEGNVFVQENDELKVLSYRWYYNGLHTISFPISTYDYLQAVGRERSFAREYGYYVQDESSIIDSLAQELISIAAINKYSDEQTVSFIASFVQSLKGTSDFYDDYPQFSVETLYLGTGDCEDMAILGSRVLSAAGYDVVLIELDDHVGIGVAINGSGDSFTFDNTTYYYTEMTGVDYVVGELPEEYRNSTPLIFNPSYTVLDPSWEIKKLTLQNDSWYTVTITLENDFTGDLFGFIEYKNYSSNVSVESLKEERLVTMMLPVLPSLDHRLILEFRGVSVNTVYLQTAWVTEY